MRGVERKNEKPKREMPSSIGVVSVGGRCPRCHDMYVGASLSFLYSDETGYYCTCGGRLQEAVEPASERHYRLSISENLRVTGEQVRLLLERRADRESVVEVLGDGRGYDFVRLTVKR